MIVLPDPVIGRSRLASFTGEGIGFPGNRFYLYGYLCDQTSPKLAIMQEDID